MPTQTCDRCGVEFTSVKANARFCSEAHRVAAKRARDHGEPEAVDAEPVDTGEPGPMELSVAEQLATYGDPGHLAAQALDLAHRLDPHHLVNLGDRSTAPGATGGDGRAGRPPPCASYVVQRGAARADA